MKNQLPQDEIQKLFAFVESKNMTYKDVQYEIVDHLASAMEVMKEENPEWPYSLCLQEVYNKFPITGFALLQMEKEEALNKYWKKKLWPYVMEFFKLPKIILTIGVFIILQQLFNMIEPITLTSWKLWISPSYFIYFIPLLLILPVILYYRKHKFGSFKNKLVNQQEELLYIKAFNQSANYVSGFLFIAPLYVNNVMITHYDSNQLTFSGYHSYLLAWFVVSISILIYLFNYRFPRLLKAEAEQKYAHINMKLVWVKINFHKMRSKSFLILSKAKTCHIKMCNMRL